MHFTRRDKGTYRNVEVTCSHLYHYTNLPSALNMWLPQHKYLENFLCKCALNHFLCITCKYILTSVVSYNSKLLYPEPWLVLQDFLQDVKMKLWKERPLSFPQDLAVNTHISPKDSRLLQGKVTSAVQIQTFSISFPLICTSYLKSTIWYSIFPWNSEAHIIRIASLPQLVLYCM